CPRRSGAARSTVHAAKNASAEPRTSCLSIFRGLAYRIQAICRKQKVNARILRFMRRAKIVCTLGPASRDPAVIGRLIDEGRDVARLNFSHGTREDHARTAELVRAEAKKRDRAVAILQDLQGPKIRVGTFSGGFAELEAGRDFLITAREIVGSPYGVSTPYARPAEEVQPGAALPPAH